MINTTADRLAHEFAKLVNARLEHERDDLCAGMIPDIAEYKRRAGLMAGLRESLELLNEAAAICDGKPQT